MGEVFFDVSNEEAESFAEKQKELKEQQVCTYGLGFQICDGMGKE